MRIALLISGGGTTAQAIFEACQSGRLKNSKIACVIASSSEVPGIQRLISGGFPADKIFVVDPKNFSGSASFGEKILEVCENTKVEFIGQYGWLCLTPENVVKAYEGMMTNQHPGPLDIGRPDFGGPGMFGKRVISARLLFVQRTGYDFWTEATAQRVAVNFDEGGVLNRKQVEILPDDTVETLAARLLPFEHEVQIQTLEMFENGTLKEITRPEPLVKPEEYTILEECKREAIKLYPRE